MPRSRSDQIDAALLESVQAHPRDLTRTVADQVGVSRQAVAARAKALVEGGFLARSGTTRPTYVLGPKRQGRFTYEREGLAEDRVWREDVAPLLSGLPANVLDIAHHGISEMVNNAVDHSDGTRVEVLVVRDTDNVLLLVEDNGVGIFGKISRALGLPDVRLALLELGKGKFTTDPQNHTGEGVFFTSRMFDLFQIASGELVFYHDGSELDDALYDVDEPPLDRGTRVVMRISATSSRTVKEIFDEFSSGPEDYSFAKTIVPVRLARIGNENLVSRAQAKRLMQRVDQFRCVVLDFAEIESIGQAFADEVFRVFANAHPDVELVAENAVPEVQQMIRRAEVARDRDNGRLSLR